MDEIHDGDGNVTLEVDRDAVRDAINAIQQLDEDELRSAFFRTNTVILNTRGEMFPSGERLPGILRTGIFRDILIEKIQMDTNGLAEPASTFIEYLYRKNRKLYDFLTKDNRFEYQREEWFNDIMTMVVALESELNMHLKYFEQSIIGDELFFRPLVTLINHYKSQFVRIHKAGVRYIFGDKVDAGGNSNMFKLFDQMYTTIHWLILSRRGRYSAFGLYDTEHRLIHRIFLKDRSTQLNMSSGELEVNHRDTHMGSLRLVDEVKFFFNGKEEDPNGHPSTWWVGEPGTGRWGDDSFYMTRVRQGPYRITNAPVDTEGWKEFQEVLD